MKTFWIGLTLSSIIAVCCFVSQAAPKANGKGDTNLVVTLTLTENQYKAITELAVAQGLTVEQWIQSTNSFVLGQVKLKSFEDRLKLALEKFNGLNDEQKEQVVVLIEGF